MSNKPSKKEIKVSKLMFEMLVRNAGGPRRVANASGLSEQQICNYITYGYTPLIKAYKLSTALNVNAESVSYVKLFEVFGRTKTPELPIVLKHLYTNNRITEEQYKRLDKLLS